MPIRLNFRNFTGKTIPLDVEPTQTIAEVKELIATAGKGKSAGVPVLAFKGHELRDTRQIQHYDIVEKDTIHICKLAYGPVIMFRLKFNTILSVPPYKVEKITLNFEKEDGMRFDLMVKSNIKIDQLMREISIEEKIDAKQLKIISSQEDPDGHEVVTLKDLENDAVLSALSLEDEVIAVYSEWSLTLHVRNGCTDFYADISIHPRNPVWSIGFWHFGVCRRSVRIYYQKKYRRCSQIKPDIGVVQGGSVDPPWPSPHRPHPHPYRPRAQG